jgi:hypothetical protein
MDNLNFNGVGSFLAAGAGLGLVLGIVAAALLFKTGIFQRKIRLHNYLTKLNFPYIVLIFVLCSSLFFGVLGIRAKISDPFSEIEDRIVAVSISATAKASAGMRESFSGKDIPPELIYEISHIIVGFNESELTPLLLSGDKYLSYAFEARKKKIFATMEASLSQKLHAVLKDQKPITSEVLGDTINDKILPEFGKGYAADLVWDTISSRFSPVLIRIVLYGLLFFHFVLYEPALYFLWRYLKNRVSGKYPKKSQPGSRGSPWETA